MKWIAILLGLICLWIIVMSLWSLIGDGFFYHTQSPYPVIEITSSKVTFQLIREAKINLNMVSSKKVICDGEVITLEEAIVPVRKGNFNGYWSWIIPEWIPRGKDCYLVGQLTYRPFGILGPTMTYNWESEKFIIP